MLEKKLQEEVNRFHEINKYTKRLLNEQETPPVPPAGDAMDTPPVPPAGGMNTPPVPPAGGMDTGDMNMETAMPEDDTEEIDITDLVNMTKSIKKDFETSKQDHGSVVSKMDTVFQKLDDLAQKLSEMDSIIKKIDELGVEVKEMKPETPVEKLEMRSLDSYPYSQKPLDFFSQKQAEMKLSGKNQYELTKNEINDYSKERIKDSFNPDEEENDFRF